MPIDTHVHLAADDRARYPLAEARPFTTDEYENPAEEFLRAMDAAGVEGALVVQPFGLYGYDNAYHADAAAKYPQRLVGVCGLSASLPDAPALLRYWVKDRGMRGLRALTRDRTKLDDPRFLNLMAEAERLDIPVCLLLSRDQPHEIAALASRFPGIRFALDHLGVSIRAPDEALDPLLDLAAVPNIYLKFSTPLFLAGPGKASWLPRLLDRFGPDRLMWGTNYPVTDEGGYANTVEISRRALASLPEPVQYALFTGTALRLWPQLRGARIGPTPPGEGG